MAAESALLEAISVGRRRRRFSRDNFEQSNAPEAVTESGHNSVHDSLNGGVDESETKRPRFESSGDNVDGSAKRTTSIEKRRRVLWVYEDNQMIQREVTYVPALYKIFDDILVNAALDANQTKEKTLNVKIDANLSRITIRASAVAIPVEKLPQPHDRFRQIYRPELLLACPIVFSTETFRWTYCYETNPWAEKANFANIHSTEFVVEIADGTRKNKFKQEFAHNMGTKSTPAILDCKENENWTEITFKPDLELFDMPKLENDDVALMTKRVVDIAGCLGKTLNVQLNGQAIQFKSFSEYCLLYMNSADASSSKPLPRFEEHVHDRWQICITRSCCQEFLQVSFVNGVETLQGGTHVDYVTSKIASYLVGVINNKESRKSIYVKPRDVKNHLWVFVNAVIDNPAFDSQTGESLTVGAGKFGSSWDFSPKFLDKVAKSDIVRDIEEFKLQQRLEKKVNSHFHAHRWGTKESGKCTLILTPGDAGLQLAIDARSIAGNDHYGVFCLSRELLNVREASNKRIMQNADITMIKEILGLQDGVNYDDVKSLKYGHVMIMTHQDHDGSYMKGLLINLFHTLCPALLKAPFLQDFKIPIVKAKHCDGKRIESFHTIPEYVAWKESLKNEAKNWTVQYYERLETSYDEMKECFKDIDKYKRDFVWENDEDNEAEELAFTKKKIEARKNWLQKFVRGTFLDPTEKKIKYRDFVNKELVYYFIRDNERSIPSIVDGMTPGQRAILVYLIMRDPCDKMRVEDLSFYVSTCSAYRHGEKSLASTIIGMAQDYVGSNNINLLLPNGRFGTRIEGGKDHIDPWCLYTELSPMARLLFPKEDDIFLTYLNEVGQSDEVGLSVVDNWFVPIIPIVLVNGCEGRGSVWSSSVPSYSPLVIIENIMRLLEGGEPMVAMHPWYKGFMGSIKKNTTEDSYTISGNIEMEDEKNLRITELPIRRWTHDYHEFLNSVSAYNNKGVEDPLVQKFCNGSRGESVLFSVCVSKGLSAVKKERLLKKKLKLTTCVGTSNMHLFDSRGVIKKYETPEEILQEFFHARLKIYEDRKAFVLAKLKKDKLKCENECRFIDCVGKGLIDRESADLFRELEELDFVRFSEKENISQVGLTKESVENSSGYEYLLSLEVETCDLEKMLAERKKLQKVVQEMEKDTVKSKWMRDLVALRTELTRGNEYQKNLEALEKSLHDACMDDGPSKENPQKKNQKTSNQAFVEDLMEVSAETAEKPSLTGTKRKGPASKRSPDNKARKFRESPSNKKSGSILGDDEEEDATDELGDSESDDGNDSDAEEDESDGSDESDDGDDSDAEEEESDASDESDSDAEEEEESDGSDESDGADDSNFFFTV